MQIRGRDRIRRDRRRQRRAGFTLTEVMVAIGVMLVAVVGSFASQMASVNLMRTSRETNVAMMDLQAAMDRILLTPHLGIPAAFANGQPIAAFDDLHLPDQSIVVTYPGFAGGTTPNVLQISLLMTWTDFQGRQRSLSLATNSSA